MIKFVISTVLLSGAFFTGVAFASIARKKNLLEKIKKLTIKKNLSASSKEQKK